MERNLANIFEIFSVVMWVDLLVGLPMHYIFDLNIGLRENTNKTILIIINTRMKIQQHAYF